MSEHLTINRHILTADEVVAKLRAIHDDVQTKWHDQWNWINADFYVECLDSLLKSQAATIAAANKRIAELERIIASIKLADRKKADSLNSYRVDLETAIGQRDEARSAQVTDEQIGNAMREAGYDTPGTKAEIFWEAVKASRAQKGSPK